MSTTIGSTFTLEDVAKHFKQWRSVKKRGERIPDHLWSESVNLLSTHAVSQVTRTLRLSGTDLNKRRRNIWKGQSRQGSGGEAFVEIDRTLVNQALSPDATAVCMELERPDGQRLRIRSTREIDMPALIERFMGAQSCCN